MPLICLAALAVGLLAVPTTAPTSAASAGPAAVPLRVMSFNVRYGHADDGDDRWEARRDLLIETIRGFAPDLLGTQEVLAHQRDHLRAALAEHALVGVGREDGKEKGEFAAILYRPDRFELLDSGTYWLSHEPTKVASVGWDAALTRIMTWAKLRDRRDGRALLFVNTHWDHRGERARLESAKLMRRLVRQIGDLPTIVTGDFNCTEADAPYGELVGDSLIDTYRALHPRPEPDAATFHGFKGGTNGGRIDWILCSPSFAVRDASIDHSSRDGRYPSDHYPITAIVEGVNPLR